MFSILVQCSIASSPLSYPLLSHLVLNLIHQALELHEGLGLLLTETQLHSVGNVLEVLHLLLVVLPQHGPAGNGQPSEQWSQQQMNNAYRICPISFK